MKSRMAQYDLNNWMTKTETGEKCLCREIEISTVEFELQHTVKDQETESDCEEQGQDETMQTE